MLPPAPSRLQPAAQYLRASTGLQPYSLEHQTVAIAAYAKARGYRLVATFSDGDRSGLDLKARPALQELLRQALSGAPAFSAILVYDVSRWGRFQDIDQGAHYEFLCRQAGVAVEYCVEPFDNDGSFEASLLKYLKRSMAAEFSRDQSAKVRAAKYAMAAKGFFQCGSPPYGLRRAVVDGTGRLMGVLQHGEYKSANSYRTILVPGPEAEVAAVRRAFHLYVVTGAKAAAIAEYLTAESAPLPDSGRWTGYRVRQMLGNPAYVGTYRFGRTSAPLKTHRLRRPPSQWVEARGAFTAIVPQDLFDHAQALLAVYRRRSDAQMLEELSTLARTRRLTAQVIDDAPDLSSAKSYARRFGGLKAAYRQIRAPQPSQPDDVGPAS
ncbi:MAG: recombinase family protein [Phenylobacterium sp.]|uniref:recombinase family protein n=1 Tax=Phenylobacterium sp. TaxID=1871053 RepID=UPI001B4C3AEA|nr:recombinase family protein [Phenylobacterium sp.]MBP7648466.1 recombinase family protein [Phenylobacterium sp.]MBP7818044.1 recombinase family protein [Phenylobacterium sp.]MBP9753804.1 recombinase family protein [Phenylobacterium sp.]